LERPEIIIVTTKDVESITDSVASAFVADPFFRWIYKDPNQFFLNVRKMAPLFIRKASIGHGGVAAA